MSLGHKVFLHDLAALQELTDENTSLDDGTITRTILPLLKTPKRRLDAAFKAWAAIVVVSFCILTLKIALEQVTSMIHWR